MVGELIVAINLVTKPRGGYVLVAPLDVPLSENSVVQPDLIYASKKKWCEWGDRVCGIPDLLSEIDVDALWENMRMQVGRLPFAREELQGTHLGKMLPPED